MQPGPPSIPLAIGAVDLGTGLLTLRGGAQRQLTDQERTVLGFLAARPQQDVDRELLQHRVLGFAPTAVSRAVDHTIKRLRLKVEAVPARPTHVITVQGVGYRFVPLRDTGAGAGSLHLGRRTVDLDRLEVRGEGLETTSLSSIEGQLLERLLARDGRPVAVEDLLAEVWQVRDLSRTKLVGKAVYRLRAKLEEDPGEPVFLQTIRGRGLALVLPSGARQPPAARPVSLFQGRPSTGSASSAPTSSPAPESSEAPESVGATWVCDPPPMEVLGRDRERALVEAALQPRGAMVTLGGAGGMGKTTLARLVGSHWPDPACFVDLTTVTDDQGLQEAVAAAHGVDLGQAGGPDVVAHALGSAGPALVVLDNAESCTEAVRAFVQRIRRAAPEVRLLITTREPLHDPTERLVRLEGLDPAHSRALFERRTTMLGAPAASAEEVEQLTRSLHHMPLAIEIAAARVPLLGVAGILSRLDAPLRLLRSRHTLSPRHASLHQVLQVSWAPLPEEARRALAAMAMFHGDFALEAAEAVLDEDDGLELLEELLDRMLLSRRADGRLALSLAVAEFAQQEIDPGHEAWLAEATERRLLWFETLGGDLSSPGSEPPPEAYGRLLPELEGALRAVREALVQGQRDRAAAILLWVLPVLSRRQMQRRAAQWVEALGSPDDLGPQVRTAIFHRFMVLHFSSLQAETALALAEQARALDPGPEADTGVLTYRIARGPSGPDLAGDLQRAEALLARDDLPPALRLELYRSMGSLYLDPGRRKEWCAERIRCAAEAGLAWALSDAHYQLADLLAYSGQVDEAEEPAQAMVAPYQTAGLGEPGKYSGIMGAIRTRQGRLPEAEAFCTRAYELAAAGGALAFEAWICGTLGKIAGTRGDYEACIRWFTLAGAGAAQLGDHRGVALSQTNLGEGWRRQGMLAEARSAFAQAVELFEKLGEDGMLCTPLRCHGRLELEAGDPVAATALLQRALDSEPHASSRRWLTLAVLADARARLGHSDSLEQAREAVAGMLPTAQGEDAVNVYVHAGRVAAHMGQLAEARELADRAIRGVKELALDERAETRQLVDALLEELARLTQGAAPTS